MKLSATVVSATLAIILVLSYFLWSFRQKRKIQLEDCVTLFLSGPGLVGGVLLLASMYNPSLLSSINEYEIYVGLGGLSLLFSVIKGMRKVFSSESLQSNQ
jgi:ABC-type molybdate transport system permease subunit